MLDDRAPARIPKWPFYLADLVLSAVAVYALYWLGGFQGSWDVAVVAAALVAAAIAAWISIIPWLAEYRSQVKLAENETLTSSLEQIQRIDQVAEQIKLANSQWQNVQDASQRTVKAAAEISEKMRVEAEEFMKFIQSAHDQERTHLRLEVEKMKRAEGDWLKVVVQMMDHVHALTQAGERSGQQALITQLQQFQKACRDVARRIGLVPFLPSTGEPYDERAHQLPDTKFQAPEDSKIGQVLATGYMFQGQLLRRSLVLLANPESSGPQQTEPAAATEPPVEEYFAPEPESEEDQPGSESVQVGEPHPGSALEPQLEPQIGAQDESGLPQEHDFEPVAENEPQAEAEPSPEVETPIFTDKEAEPASSSNTRDYQEEETFEEIEPVNWEDDEDARQARAKSQTSAQDTPEPLNHSEASDQGEDEPDQPRSSSAMQPQVPENPSPYPRQLPLV